MELDEVDPVKWAQLENATDDFIVRESARFEAAAAALTEGLGPARGATAAGPTAATPRGDAGAAAEMRLRSRRQLLVVRAARSATDPSAGDAAALACSRLAECAGLVDLQALTMEAPIVQDTAVAAMTAMPSPAREPESPVRALPSSSVLPAALQERERQEGAAKTQATVEVDISSTFSMLASWFSPAPKAAAPQSLPTSPMGWGVASNGRDVQSDKAASQSQPTTPAAPQSPFACATAEPAGPVPHSRPQSLPLPPRVPSDALSSLEHTLREASGGVGVVHLALRPSSDGLVLQWSGRKRAVLEPSEWCFSNASINFRHSFLDFTILLVALFVSINVGLFASRSLYILSF
jgi:hypothetical protein